MKKQLLFLLFWLPLTLAGQSMIFGKVLDEHTHEKLNNATIKIFKPQTQEVVTGGMTDFEGDFRLPVEPGHYDIEITKPGYYTALLLSVEIFRCKTPVHEVLLTPLPTKI